MENNSYIVERANKIIKICENASKDTFIYDYIMKSIEILSFYSLEKEVSKKSLLLAIKVAKKILALNEDILEDNYTLSIEVKDININVDTLKLEIIKKIYIDNEDNIKIICEEMEENVVEKEEKDNIKPIITIPDNIKINNKDIEKIDIENTIYLKVFNSINSASFYKVEKKNITFNYIIKLLNMNYIYTTRKTSYVEQLNAFFILSKDIILLPKEINELELSKKNILEKLTDNATPKQEARRKLLLIESNLDSLDKHRLFLIKEINQYIDIKKLLKNKSKNIKFNSIFKYVLFGSVTLNLYLMYLINNYISILTNQY